MLSLRQCHIGNRYNLSLGYLVDRGLARSCRLTSNSWIQIIPQPGKSWNDGDMAQHHETIVPNTRENDVNLGCTHTLGKGGMYDLLLSLLLPLEPSLCIRYLH